MDDARTSSRFLRTETCASSKFLALTRLDRPRNAALGGQANAQIRARRDSVTASLGRITFVGRAALQVRDALATTSDPLLMRMNYLLAQQPLSTPGRLSLFRDG